MVTASFIVPGGQGRDSRAGDSVGQDPAADLFPICVLGEAVTAPFLDS